MEIFHKVQKEVPEFIQELAEKGLKQTTIYKPEAQYKGGSTLRQAFGKNIKDGDSEEVQKKKSTSFSSLLVKDHMLKKKKQLKSKSIDITVPPNIPVGNGTTATAA